MMLPGSVLDHYTLLAVALLAIGSVGFLMRRNLLVQLMCLELMLNAANLLLVAYNRVHPAALTGQMFACFVIAVAAAEVAVGLAIAVAFFRLRATVHSDEANRLRH
jgi:NADH-quinone oxidoreductase subunit K